MKPIELRLTARVSETLRQRLAASAADRENAGVLLRELLARAPEGRKEAAEREELFASLALGHALLERAESLFEGGPVEAAHLAGLAATIGSRLAAPWTRLEREALQGRARSVEGEALRLRGRLAEARWAHRRAFRHFETLPVGCSERADFCRYLARLRRDQGRDDEALALMARALERHAAFRDPRARRRAQECRLELAWMHLEDLETDEAVSHFEAALFEESALELEPAGPPSGQALEGWLAVRHGLALAYADLRREGAARARVAEIAGGAAGLQGGPGLDPLRLKRVEASVLQRLDANEEAAELLFAAWSGYALRGEPYEAALALLELAELRAEQGSAAELERLRQGLSALAGLRANVLEPLAFGLEFAQSHGLAAVEMLEALKLFVPRARHDPEARFALVPASGGPEWEEG